MISDNELMFKVSRGDINKIGLLYERYSTMLYGYFFKLTGMQAISEDLVNDTFMKIIKYSKNYRGEGIFRIWMFRIARSVFADNYKKMNKMIYTDNITDNPHTNRQGIEPSEIHDKNERIHLLHKALLKLNKKEREVLVLSNFEGLKYKEIARILKCSEGAVKVRVYRAMQNLRTAYLKIQN